MTAPRTLRIKNPADLIATVPTVLGFHPEDSVVLLTVGAASQPFFGRVDMPSCPDELPDAVAQVSAVAAEQQAAGVALVVYSDDAALSSLVLSEVERRLEPAGVRVRVAVRVDGARWYGLGPGAHEDDLGTPYDVTTHPFTLQAVVDGRVVHPSRDALRDSLLPVDPDEVEAVAIALGEAADRLVAAARHPLAPPDRRAVRTTLVAEGRWLQERVRRFVDDRERLSATEVGRLLAALVSAEVRDVAWAEIDLDTALLHVDLWRDVVRRSPLPALAPPAALLAFAAWQAGDGALAWCAVDRCHEADPDYAMGSLVSHALAGAVPPDAWTPLPPGTLTLFAG